MNILTKIAGIIGGEVVKETITGVGNGISNLLDRKWPKKMSESERFDKIKDLAQIDLQRSDIEVKDVNKAREMWMTFLRTQKLPWLARFMNAIYRPFCGFMAILYLTDRFWAQVLEQLINGFHWKLIERDPIVDGLLAIVMYFFFGYRQRSKEKGVTEIG